MLNCIKADMLRVQRKKSYIIMSVFIIILAVALGLLAVSGLFKGNKSDNYASMVGAAFGLSNLLIGIPVFNSVFSDDFKSRSMQVSIGFGISRTKMVLIRFIEFLLIFAEAFLAFSICVYIMGAIFGIRTDAMNEVVKGIWQSMISIVGFASFSMMFVYLTQNGTFGLVVYILLATSAFTLIFTGIDLIPFLSDNNISISAITIDGMYGKMFDEKLSQSKNIFWGVMYFACYVVLPLLLTLKIFKHKELDF